MSSSKLVRLLLSLATVCFAQQHSSICITATDASDAPLKGATLAVVGLTISERYTAVTDQGGRACVSRLSDGYYYLETRQKGFLNVRYHPVRVTYPTKFYYKIVLPVGEIVEGGLAQDSIITGTLKERTTPLPYANICAYDVAHKETEPTCTKSNELGQYVLSLTPGKYNIKVSSGREVISAVTIDVSTPGTYRELLHGHR